MYEPSNIELNDEFRRALDVMENTSRNVFVTGRAGTGKSTLLSYFRDISEKNMVVLAPTGVAALNVKGQTIHSFFGFKPGITVDKVSKARSKGSKKNVYKALDAIIIDEISMVRADLLDCVDKFLQLNGPKRDRPFGGIQMIFFGDLYQLSPVVTGTEKKVFQSLYETPYFYSSKAFGSVDWEFIELKKVYRQHDQHFLSMLNSIRNNSIDEEGIRLLNKRYMPDFEPPPDDFYVYLATTNKIAEEINTRELARLPGDVHYFDSYSEGEFGDEYLPTGRQLKLKAGAQIMMINNDPAGRWVNGSIGKVLEIVKEENDEDDIVIAELTDGEIVEILPYTWEVYRFFAEEGRLQSEVVGRFTQYPLTLAWAMTIHKSQGKTFDKVIIDIGKGTFSYGQVYVALSRCTSLEGVVLKRPVLKKHIWTDYKVVDFLTSFQYTKAEKACSLEEKMEAIKKAIEENAALEMLYLRPNDEKTKRVVIPKELGEMEYRGKRYIGMKAYCTLRAGERVFRVDRILELNVLRQTEA
jgi:hypothetical protein